MNPKKYFSPVALLDVGRSVSSEGALNGGRKFLRCQLIKNLRSDHELLLIMKFRKMVNVLAVFNSHVLHQLTRSTGSL